jgi:hypothetical protein
VEASLSHYLPTPRSPLWPPRGPVLFETGRAPAIPLLPHREMIFFASTYAVSRPRRNTKLLRLPRNNAVMPPSSNNAHHWRATRPWPAPLSWIRVPSARAPAARATARLSAHANAAKIAELHYTNKRYQSNLRPVPLRPEHSPDFSSNPSPSAPPAKRTRKVARRRCEAELLRDGREEEALVLSPLNTTPQL